MNLFRQLIEKRRQIKAIRKIEAERTPQPDLLKRRLAQFSGARRERFLRNVGDML